MRRNWRLGHQSASAFLVWLAEHADPPEYWVVFQLDMRIFHDLDDLWRATGHCLFYDVDRADLPAQATLIAARYLHLIEEHRGESERLAMLYGLQQTIDCLRTKYCFMAYEMLQLMVSHDGPCLMSRPRPEVRPEVRAEVHEAMTRWFKDQTGMPAWDSESRIFRHGYDGSLAFPKRVYELMREASLPRPESDDP